jgi:hypothetical protein
MFQRVSANFREVFNKETYNHGELCRVTIIVFSFVQTARPLGPANSRKYRVYIGYRENLQTAQATRHTVNREFI